MIRNRVRPSLLVAAAGLVVALAARPGGAQERGGPRPLALREALTVAVRQNPSLAAESLDVVIADAEIEQARGLDDYVVTGAASWSSNRGGSPFPGAPPFESDTISVSGGLVRALPDGGRAGVEFVGSYTLATDFFTQGQKAEQWQPRLSVSFYQPILRGFGESTARAPRRRARAARAVQELEREAAAAALVRDVVQAYWELAYAAQDLEIRRASLALAREQLRITRAGIEVGKLAPTEALPVEQAIAVREEAVLLAEQALSERSLEVRRLIGMEIAPGEIDLVARDRLEVAPVEPDLDDALAAAFERNPQLAVARALGEQAMIEVEVTENGLLPQLDFNANAGPLGNRNDLGDALEQMVTFGSYGLSAGVVFSMPLGNRAAEGAHQAARARHRRVKMNEADIRAQIAVQVVRAVNLVRSAQKRMEVLAKASALARQNVDLERARWEVGKATQFDVLRRQDELAQAELLEARARTDHLKAVAILESLTGDILPRYGIQLR